MQQQGGLWKVTAEVGRDKQELTALHSVIVLADQMNVRSGARSTEMPTQSFRTPHPGCDMQTRMGSASKWALLQGEHCLTYVFTVAMGCTYTAYCCTAVLLTDQHLSLCACRVAWVCGASMQQRKSSRAEAGQHPAQPQVLLDAGAPAERHQGSL